MKIEEYIAEMEAKCGGTFHRSFDRLLYAPTDPTIPEYHLGRLESVSKSLGVPVVVSETTRNHYSIVILDGIND